ncbi:MAG TPA: PDZ domain-containing protein [Humisphaera sp.]
MPHAHPRLPTWVVSAVAALLPVAAAAAGPATGPSTEPSTRPAALAPATQPPAQPATQPSTRPVVKPTDAAKDKQVQDLTRRAIRQIEKGKLDDAEATLAEALTLDPDHVTNLYNSACLFALKGKPDLAMDRLEKAAEAGWADFVHLGRDPDLKSLRDLPRYKALLAKKDEYLNRAADRSLAELKAQFGEGYLYEIDRGRKLIFATNTDATTLAELKRWLTDQANSQWAELFEHRPDAYISVVLPTPADYRKIVRMPNVGGFYSDDAKLLIAQRLGQTVTHEFTHALHAADKAPLGQDHPIWIAEGLATMYEGGRFEGGKLVPDDNARHNVLLTAAAMKKLIPLAEMVKMDQPEFVRRAVIAYGQSASVMRYLYDHKLLRPFYEAYKKSYDQDATGKLAIETVTGKSLDEFEKDWKAWMVARPRVPGSTGPQGPVIGARLGDANDGLKVEQVVTGGPAAKAGLKAGDVVVGVGDAQVRDYESFVPLVIQLKPGDVVNLKVRREGKYIELPVTLGKRSELEPKR